MKATFHPKAVTSGASSDSLSPKSVSSGVSSNSCPQCLHVASTAGSSGQWFIDTWATHHVTPEASNVQHGSDFTGPVSSTVGCAKQQCYDSGSPGDVLSNSQEDSGFNTDKVVDDVCVSGEVDMVNEPGLGDNSPLIDDAPLELMSTGGGICEAEVGPLESNGAGAAQSSGSASSEEGDRIAEDDRPIDDNGNLVQENVNAHPMAFQSSNWRAAVDAEYNALLADGT
ncbi:hypothetical protein V6N11_083318 [Hibiscus sabdariffa]|uniref:Uncharacterized protein n=1 Tax=Hibiscus sabdariffa TaxID=183260 RepID=A0ABR2QM19_9ROSI